MEAETYWRCYVRVGQRKAQEQVGDWFGSLRIPCSSTPLLGKHEDLRRFRNRDVLHESYAALNRKGTSLVVHYSCIVNVIIWSLACERSTASNKVSSKQNSRDYSFPNARILIRALSRQRIACS